MRVKQILAYAPFVDGMCSKLRLFWNRVTATRLTTVYFLFSIIHCFVQAFLQGDAFSINARAATYLAGIVVKGNSSNDGFYVWQHQQLRFCDFVPDRIDSSSCRLVWESKGSSKESQANAFGVGSSSSTSYSDDAQTAVSSPSLPLTSTTPSTSLTTAAASTTVSASSSALSSATSSIVSSTAGATPTAIVEIINQAGGDDDDDDDKAIVVITPTRRHFSAQILGANANGTLPIVLDGWGYHNTQILLSTDCLTSLNWPVQQLDNTKREDIAFIAFQFWVLGMSLVAILNESIPHIIASLVTHLSATAWGAFQLQQTKGFQKDFSTIITNGVCGANLLPTYWKTRADVEIPSLVLNSVALIASIILSWRLIKTFGWQTFKRVGASRVINRVYKLVLTLSVTIQLSLFFVIVSIALWLDQICNGAIGKLATAHKVYESLLIVVLLLLPIWLTTGWFAVRRELKLPMTIFLALCVAYMTGWGAMFDSTSFRWTMSQWTFFAVMMVVGVVLVIICFVVGVFCRLNFGRGLPHYLNAEEPLPGDEFIRIVPGEKGGEPDPEKIDFPTNFGAVPTFEAAYGYDDDVPPPGTRTLGPRFYSQENVPLSIDTNQVIGPEPVDMDKFTSPPAYTSSPYHTSPASSLGHGSEITVPSSVHSRTPSEWTMRSGLPSSVRPLVRKGSASSQRSFMSARSGRSTDESMRPRWVIE